MIKSTLVAVAATAVLVSIMYMAASMHREGSLLNQMISCRSMNGFMNDTTVIWKPE